MSSVKLDDEGSLFKQLLLEKQDFTDEDLSFFPVRPEPGFCVKVKDDKNQKVFINICKSSELKAPPDISDSKLMTILESDTTDFRIPMSLGEPHFELDKSGQLCSVYDVIINNTFFDQIQENKIVKKFLLTVVSEGLEDKYGITLSRDWNILKNRKFLGSIQEQNIRRKSKPMITEMNSLDRTSGNENNVKKKPLITALDKEQMNEPRLIEPHCSIIKDPVDCQPQFLVAEIKLPDVKSVKDIELDLGEDRILLNAKPKYFLDIFLPYLICQEESGAQFNKKNKVLTLTLPVTCL